MRLSIFTLGCKLNQAESNEIADKAIKAGHVITPFTEKADICIVRACAVTQNASRTTRQVIRQAKRRGSIVIASGCLEDRRLPEIDFIADTPAQVLAIISRISKKSERTNTSGLKMTADRTRAFIKIQTGCDFHCAYCVIPRFRGKSKSISPDSIVRTINKSEKRGCKEIVLTGVNICLYKYMKLDLAGLIKYILLNTKIERIRLGSLDPRLITDGIIMLALREQRLMPHWHLSLQSGSDSVLKRMNRGYTAKHYLNIVNKLRKANPLFSFTTDIIVGFPGETEDEFSDSTGIVKKVKFAKVHAFRYSERPGTTAVQLTDRIRDGIKSTRLKKLIAVSETTSKEFRIRFMNTKRNVLLESKKDGFWSGFSPEYLSVRYKSSKNLKNKIVSLKLTKPMLT